MRFTQLAKITPGDGDDWFNPVSSKDTPLYVDLSPPGVSGDSVS